MLKVVNDRAGQNRARPNRAGSVIFTEGSAEPARPISAKFDQNSGPKLTKICLKLITKSQFPLSMYTIIDFEIES